MPKKRPGVSFLVGSAANSLAKKSSVVVMGARPTFHTCAAVELVYTFIGSRIATNMTSALNHAVA